MARDEVGCMNLETGVSSRLLPREDENRGAQNMHSHPEAEHQRVTGPRQFIRKTKRLIMNFLGKGIKRFLYRMNKRMKKKRHCINRQAEVPMLSEHQNSDIRHLWFGFPQFPALTNWRGACRGMLEAAAASASMLYVCHRGTTLSFPVPFYIFHPYTPVITPHTRELCSPS